MIFHIFNLDLLIKFLILNYNPQIQILYKGNYHDFHLISQNFFRWKLHLINRYLTLQFTLFIYLFQYRFILFLYLSLLLPRFLKILIFVNASTIITIIVIFFIPLSVIFINRVLLFKFTHRYPNYFNIHLFFAIFIIFKFHLFQIIP